MDGPQHTPAWFAASGLTPGTNAPNARYVRFLNAVLIVFAAAQVPILPLLVTLELLSPLLVNLAAISLCAVSFLLNRRGHHLAAKVLFVSVVAANTLYFSVVLGADTPTHFWLIPGAALGVLLFKPSEWLWTVALVGCSMLGFAVFEFAHPNPDSLLLQFQDAETTRVAGQASTVAAVALALFLVGMMHQRFTWSEEALSMEKAKSERLLRAILPDTVAQELRETGATEALRHEDVSLLFADLVGFTPLAASMPAEEVVAVLAEVFTRFDELISRCGVEKIKTIGDAYMVAGGVPQAVPDHAERLATCALGMLDIIEEFRATSGHPLELRIGLHRGPAVAGVIGTTRFAYDLWGESVNLAARLESSSEPGRIQVSEAFRTGSEQTCVFESRGQVVLKGVGPTRTHWLVQMHPGSGRP